MKGRNPGSPAVLLITLALTACGGGGEGADGYSGPNRAPELQRASLPAQLVALHPIDYDPLRSDVKFSDPDADPLTYELTLPGAADLGITIQGTRVTGAFVAQGWFLATLSVHDNHGNEASIGLPFVVASNSEPTVAHPNELLLVSAGSNVDYDVTQAGATIADADGDRLSYQIQLSANTHGLTVSGTRIMGKFTGTGAIRVTVVARDVAGATATDEFNIAAPVPAPGRPQLPSVSHVYDDFELSLPAGLLESRRSFVPFNDTTPAFNPTTNAGATLGRVLFYDRRLSSTNTHACGSCHQQQNGFANSTRFSVGATGEQTPRNAMSLANARYNYQNRYFSDNRTSTLETLALQPIQNHIELANSLPNVIKTLSATDFYPALFQAAFGSPQINADRISMALAQFLRALISYRSKAFTAVSDGTGGPFPQSSAAYTAQENVGRQLFINSNCGFCHRSAVFVTAMPSNNGLDVVAADPGAGGGTFRSASLINIARSAPYMHDGRFATLREVIDHYDHGMQPSLQLDGMLRSSDGVSPRRFDFTDSQKDALEAFLGTLTDEAMLADPRFSDPFP